MPAWTPEQEEFLRENWGRGIDYLTWKFKTQFGAKRTKSSILNKSTRMKNLGRAFVKSDYMSIKECAEALKVSTSTITYWSKKLGLKVKRVKISQNRYGVDLKDLLDWLKNNQHRWDSRKVEFNILGLEPDWLTEKRKKDLKGFKKPGTSIKGSKYSKLLTDKQIARAVEKKLKGESYKNLAQEYFVTEETMRNYVKQYMNEQRKQACACDAQNII